MQAALYYKLEINKKTVMWTTVNRDTCTIVHVWYIHKQSAYTHIVTLITTTYVYKCSPNFNSLRPM